MNHAEIRTRIIDMATRRMPPREIADKLGCSRAKVYETLRHARQNGFDIPRFHAPGRRPGFYLTLSPELRSRLAPHADRRGMEVAELARRLLNVIAADQMVDAVLDDA